MNKEVDVTQKYKVIKVPKFNWIILIPPFFGQAGEANPARRVLYVVPESPQVYTLYHLAQPQGDHPQDHHRILSRSFSPILLLCNSWLCREKDFGSLILLTRFQSWIMSILFPLVFNQLDLNCTGLRKHLQIKRFLK